MLTHYLWCGERICEARDSSDNVLARYYAQGERHGSDITYYAQDQIGSVVATVNPQGQITARLKYDSYGNMFQSSGTLPDYRYAGLFYHPATGLSLATWRAYDPKTGRWLSRDPIRELGGVNLYGYVAQNPLSHRDPLGLLNPAEAACIADPNPVCVGGVVGDIATTVVGVGIIVYNHYHSDDASEQCPQDKKLTNGEIDRLIKGGVHPHDLKDNSKQDLFKDKDGNIRVKPKSGIGPGDPTGINMNDF